MCRMPTNSSRVLGESRTIQIIEPICSTAGSPISITNETMPGFLTTSGTFVRDGKVTTLTRYYITSRTLTADQLLEAVRGHWSIENSVLSGGIGSIENSVLSGGIGRLKIQSIGFWMSSSATTTSACAQIMVRAT